MSGPLEDPLVKALARAFAQNHLAHVGGPDADTLVTGTPNWHFFTRDAETAIRVVKELYGEAALRPVITN